MNMNDNNTTKYLKAIILRLDAFESEIIFERNYSIEDREEAISTMNEFKSDTDVCQLFEMSFSGLC